MQTPRMQHHGRIEQRHQYPIAIAVSHQKIVEHRDREQGHETLDETGARGPPTGVCKQGLVVHSGLRTLPERESPSLQHAAVVIQIREHQKTVEGQRDERQKRAERPVLEDHRPVDRADQGRHQDA